ncbi:SPOR domain-containing protein [Luteimonas lutimaris]|uniref:SPOR domain-containing protein n=1 Tax=Luteimonas lutimaris TaxID=698645 RepID=A0ABP7MDE0_9GAMM|nr:SPOR domain-containing protein [Luteimonas sp.]
MEPQLKQRLIGAAVLVALAVIFLPMLVKGPAPDSGVSDVPLKVPEAPQGEYETRDLPLVVPEEVPEGGVTGMLPAPAGDDQPLPTVDTTTTPSANRDQTADGSGKMLPPTVAGGDYAVHFAAYDSSVNADTVVSRLRDAGLPAYREAADMGGKQAWRVRIGPYGTRANAEIARIEAQRVGKYDGARVIALDAAEPAEPVAAKPAPKPEPTPAPAAKPVTETAAAKPADKPVEAPRPEAKPAEAPKPAASGVGFAVQIGAFSHAEQATAKRDQLRGAGFNAFTETVNTDKGTLTRVLAGPVSSRAEAEQLNSRIKARLGAGGLVRSHP